MKSVTALSLAPDALDWLRDSHSPRVLHVFDKACNLINERGEVLSVVTKQIGNGPFNLVIEGDISYFEHLKAQSTVFILPEQLKLGDVTINTTRAKRWNPRPDWERLHLNKDKILEQLQTARYSKEGLDKTFATVSGFSTIPGFLSLILNFSSALAEADTATAKTLTSKLAGLGQGLTPAGDDFLMGAIYATWIIHPLETATTLAEELAMTATPLTTSLSAAWLRSAGKGEASVLWHEFFNAFLAGENIDLPLTKLLSVGETSGADALSGFIGVCTAYKEQIIDKCPS